MTQEGRCNDFACFLASLSPSSHSSSPQSLMSFDRHSFSNTGDHCELILNSESTLPSRYLHESHAELGIILISAEFDFFQKELSLHCKTGLRETLHQGSEKINHGEGAAQQREREPFEHSLQKNKLF